MFFHAPRRRRFDPASGAALWNHRHTTDYGLNISMPSWGDDNVMVISSAYSVGSRVSAPLAVRRQDDGHGAVGPRAGCACTSFPHPFGDAVVRVERGLRPAFVAATDVRTGAIAWQERGFARASLVAIGEKLLLLDEDGVLALVTPGPDGLSVHAKADVLATRAWTVPTVVGTRVYLRDRAVIKALDIG